MSDSSQSPKNAITTVRVSRAQKRVFVIYDNDEQAYLSAEYLRVMSPSAEEKGHGNTQKPPSGNKRHVGISGAETVGHYAMRIIFDDGHETGLYTWNYLNQLHIERTQRWDGYMQALHEAGLQR